MVSALNIAGELQARVRDSFSPETAFGLVHSCSINADYTTIDFFIFMYFMLLLI